MGAFYGQRFGRGNYFETHGMFYIDADRVASRTIQVVPKQGLIYFG